MNEEIFTAKHISKFFKFVSTMGIIACCVCKWLGKMPNAEVSEICAMWVVVYGIGAGTIDFNIMLDKFTGGKK